MFGLFNKKKEITPTVSIDWTEIGIDFHSHILPCVDDGVQSVEESAEILSYFKSIGHQQIYTSPHIMGEGFNNTKDGLEERFAELKSHELIQEIGMPFGLIAEYFLDEQFEKLLVNNDLLHFGKDKNILIETSMNYDFEFVKEYIFELIKKGYQPILAHPERYKYIYKEDNAIDHYESYHEMGVHFQLNLFSLVGMYGDTVRKTAEMLIDNNLYDLVSSDIHKREQIYFLEQVKNSVFLAKLIQSGNLKNKSLLS